MVPGYSPTTITASYIQVLSLVINMTGLIVYYVQSTLDSTVGGGDLLGPTPSSESGGYLRPEHVVIE